MRVRASTVPGNRHERGDDDDMNADGGDADGVHDVARCHGLTRPRPPGQGWNMPAKECTFCRIARGELDAHLVHADAAHLVFLDHRPLFAGHCLVMPRAHVETLLDLPEAAVGPLFLLVQRVSRAVERGAAADGIFNAVNNRISQSVPHVHVHVIPRRKKDGLKGFFWPRYTYSGPAEMIEVRDAIAAAMEPA